MTDPVQDETSTKNPEPLTSESSDTTSVDKKTTTRPAAFEFLTGMKEDLAVRIPLYKNDFGRPQSIIKVVNATVYAFVVQVCFI